MSGERSLDVFIANFLVVALWRGYHHAIEFSRLRDQIYLLRWLEAEEMLQIDKRAYDHFLQVCPPAALKRWSTLFTRPTCHLFGRANDDHFLLVPPPFSSGVRLLICSSHL